MTNIFRVAGNLLEWIIYNCRWLLVLLYTVVAFKILVFIVIAGGVAGNIWPAEHLETATLDMLLMIDSMMVANLAYYITIGSYLMYVRPKLSNFVNKDESTRPHALFGLTPTTLKERMAGSLITISAVNLIRILMENEPLSWNLLATKVIIHLMFIIGAIVFIIAAGHEQHEQKESNEEDSSHSASSKHAGRVREQWEH